MDISYHSEAQSEKESKNDKGKRPREFAKKLMMKRFNPKKIDPFYKAEFPALKDIAINIVANNFQLYPDLIPYKDNAECQPIPQEEQEIIISKTSTNLPITISAIHISQESYWKRACQDRWSKSQKTINLEHHGLSWKVAYLERHIEEYLQSEEAGVSLEKMKNELNAVSHWIHTLTLTNMKTSLDIDFITKNLPLLTSLTLTYGMKNIGTDELFPKDKKGEFHRQNLGIKLSEAANLGEAIKNSTNLLTLSLPANMIDDDLLRFIMAGVNMNISLIELNLSHNKIGDQGARRVAKFLMRNEILKYLDLSNNQIGYDGSRYLAQSLKINKTLTHLNLNLNSFDDKAGMKFFKDLMMNRTLQQLLLSGNSFAYQTAVKLAEYLAPPCTLKYLYIGNNQFGDDCYEILRTALNTTYNLEKLDIRGCIFSKEMSVQEQQRVEQEEEEEEDSLQQYKQSAVERQLSEVILQKYFTIKKLHFVNEDEYNKKKQQKLYQLQKQKDQLKQQNSKNNKGQAVQN